MRFAIYTALIFGIVPLQTTLLPYVSVGGIRPDLGLIAVVLVGLFGTEVEALLVGLALGFAQDLFSAGGPWVNMTTKAAVGFVAGVVGKNLANLTPIAVFVPTLCLSIGAGMVLLLEARGTDVLAIIDGLQFVLLPQALLDAVIASLLCWFLIKSSPLEDLVWNR